MLLVEVRVAQDRRDATERFNLVPVLLRLNLCLEVLGEVALFLLTGGSLRVVCFTHLH